MTEKIEWYREVLELEPNSKVFLPLAKLLVEENGDSQAIDILQRGLDRHPDFLEARLFLIELLYKTGKNDERDAEVKKLGKMFATYAGFWQAWAACLSGDNEQDTASVLRFLAATFLHGPLSLHEVLNRGLASYIPQTRMAAPKIEAKTPAEEQAAEADNEAIAGETAGQPDIEHVNNHTLEEIVQPVAEENPVEIAAAEEAGESPEAEIAALPVEHPAEEMAAEPEAGEAEGTESPAAEEGQPAPEDQTAAAEQAVVAETTQEALAEQEEPALEAEAATEELAASEEFEADEAVITEPASGESAVGESPAAMMEEIAAQVMETEPPAQEEDMVSNAAEVEAFASTAITEDQEPLAQENPEAPLASEQTPVMPEENEAAETEEPAEAQPEMPEEALAAKQEETLPAPETEKLPGTEQVPAESLFSAPPTLEEIREAANDGEDDVGGTGGESLQTIFEQNIAPGNPETPQATENLSSETSASALPVVETAQPAPAEQADELAAEEYTPKFEDRGQQYTVRTRSMAEVLAEQDDLEGALAIYRELLAAAPEGTEKNDLQLRTSTLAQKLLEAQEAASAPVEYEPGSISSKSREKLISMLEALARRVEARAQS